MENNTDNAVTYIFDEKGSQIMDRASGESKKKIWQIIPSACASLSCIPFGLALGWPCPSYPMLLKLTSPIPINLDQSAMIAGFLMIGLTIATPFSRKSLNSPKYSLILSSVLMVCGWTLMWQARNIFWLLGSRLLKGAAFGYGLGQLKIYITEMSDDRLSIILIKCINMYTFFGVVLAFSIGLFVDFRDYSIISLIFAVVTLFINILLPKTPRELIQKNKLDTAKNLMKYLEPTGDVKREVEKISAKLTTRQNDIGFMGIMRNSKLRKSFLIFVLLVFFQQMSGLPATIIYTKILFDESHCPHSSYIAIGYSLMYFLSNIVGIFILPKYNKKVVLLISSLCYTLVILAKIIVIYFRINEQYWNYTSVLVMYLFVTVHTIGLGNIPFTLISDMFPTNCRNFISNVFIMQHSMEALIITKIFQVLMDHFELYIPFCLFLCTSLVGLIFIVLFVPKKS